MRHTCLLYLQDTPDKQSAHHLAATPTRISHSCPRLLLCQRSMECTHFDLHSAALRHHTVCRARRSPPTRTSSSHSIVGSRLALRLLRTLRRLQFDPTCFRLGSFGKHSDRYWARCPHRTGCSHHHHRCICQVHRRHSRHYPRLPAYPVHTTRMIASLQTQCHRCGDVFR